MGGTLVDIQNFNPEAADLIRSHADIFEVVGRPFTHDLQTFRSQAGFLANVGAGLRAIELILGCRPTSYLPPEFMQTNRQITLLKKFGIASTFLLPERFPDSELDDRKNLQYVARGIPSGELDLVICTNGAYKEYLSNMQLWETPGYRIDDVTDIFRWRDGESFLLFPNGLEREEWLLKAEKIERRTLSTLKPRERASFPIFYPPHPFSAWSNEMSMSWFMSELADFERQFPQASPRQKAWWLLAIGSDVIASLEKPSPVVRIKKSSTSDVEYYKIRRFPRAPLGEALMSAVATNEFNFPDQSHAKMILSRHDFLTEYLAGSSVEENLLTR
jgi:hypothetical protein